MIALEGGWVLCDIPSDHPYRERIIHDGYHGGKLVHYPSFI